MSENQNQDQTDLNKNDDAIPEVEKPAEENKEGVQNEISNQELGNDVANKEMNDDQMPKNQNSPQANDNALAVFTKKPTNELSEAERATDSQRFQIFLHDSGLPISFQIIFTEIIQKKIPEEQHFQYTAQRLRELGRMLS